MPETKTGGVKVIDFDELRQIAKKGVIESNKAAAEKTHVNPDFVEHYLNTFNPFVTLALLDTIRVLTKDPTLATDPIAGGDYGAN